MDTMTRFALCFLPAILTVAVIVCVADPALAVTPAGASGVVVALGNNLWNFAKSLM
jgi:hypothetical protein